MLDYQKRKKRNKILYSNGIILLLALVSSFLVFRIIQTVPKAKEVFQNKKDVAEEVASQSEREKELMAQISRLNTPEGVEEDIREKFRLAKDGEGLIVIVDEDKEKLDKKQKESGFLGFLKRIFGN